MRPAWETPPYNVVSVSIGGFATLTNIGTAYDTIPQSKGLGCAELDFTNIGSCKFTVRVNKVGSGTQSWQLWNETDGTQLAVIDDAAAAGDNKTLTVTVTPGLTGLKRVRVRAKSTTAADDPIFYGATVILF